MYFLQGACFTYQLAEDKILSHNETNCNDVECRMMATSAECISEDISRGAAFCTYTGYGWNHIKASSCDVFAINFRSRRNYAGFNTCVTCAPHDFIHDIGISTCRACPESQKRDQADDYCVSCAAGTICVDVYLFISLPRFLNVGVSSEKYTC